MFHLIITLIQSFLLDGGGGREGGRQWRGEGLRDWGRQAGGEGGKKGGREREREDSEIAPSYLLCTLHAL